MGFRVLGLKPPRFAVGLQGTSDVAEAAADQPEVVPAQADLRGSCGGSLAERFGLLQLTLLEQQGRQVEPGGEAQARCQRQR